MGWWSGAFGSWLGPTTRGTRQLSKQGPKGFHGWALLFTWSQIRLSIRGIRCSTWATGPLRQLSAQQAQTWNHNHLIWYTQCGGNGNVTGFSELLCRSECSFKCSSFPHDTFCITSMQRDKGGNVSRTRRTKPVSPTQALFPSLWPVHMPVCPRSHCWVSAALQPLRAEEVSLVCQTGFSLKGPTHTWC